MSSLPFYPRLNAILSLCRVSNLPTVWMNVLTAALLSRPFDDGHFFLFVLLLSFALSCFYGGGMALNDLCDLEHDSVHQPFRPIPAGRLSVEGARVITYTLFVIAFACLLLAPHRAGLVAGIALLLSIWIYNRFHKRHPSTVLAMAGARLLVYFVAALALTGRVSDKVAMAAMVQASYVVVLTLVARLEGRTSARHYTWPVIPWMLAGMPIVDSIMLALFTGPAWLCVGLVGMALTRIGQRYVRGD